jgi:hypothetical protein
MQKRYPRGLTVWRRQAQLGKIKEVPGRRSPWILLVDLQCLHSKSKAKDGGVERLTGYSGNSLFFICAKAYGMWKKLEGDKV